ncbi:amino acid transporter [Aspergillus sclerotioniger CBS 115572]|uniref:Amino acid transporter n=1 Tax=Aspergillus sclerotioniger CBS 115572 TaxID=1450535 RepID=A0A317WI82_9EURO|nr:amino acid transporter [Aspergillus sclerotioniger CBS 115572]PWY83920.1 amino acid transporter [Aspergillus sclerotioniger CBS 115572]
MADGFPTQSQIELCSPRGNDFPGTSTETLLTRDALELARVGKKEVMKRRFRLASTVGFASSLMITWEAMMMSVINDSSGGPPGLIYGYIGVWIAFLSIFVSMGELASMIPSAGGQYHWTSILAPASSKRFLSHITGSITIIAWETVAVGNYVISASVLQGTVELGRPQYDPKGWHVTFITWGILLVSLLVVTYLGVVLPAIEIFILVIHIFGFFAVLFSLIALGPQSDAQSVFSMLVDLGNWHDITLSSFVGLQGTAVAFVGMDGAIHMAEEVENSSIVVPQSMLLAIVINGALGFAMLITILLKSGDIQALLDSDTKYPFMFVLENSTQSKTAAIILSSMLAILTACAGLSTLASGSRMLWSFSREKGVPGWNWIRQVHPRTTLPNHSIFIIVIATALISLINVGSNYILNITLSLIMQAFFASYMIPLSLLLYRRMQGHIADPKEANADSPDKPYIWGPFRVKGWLGIANNIFSIVCLVIMFLFGCWPLQNHPSPREVNYSIALTGGATVLAVVYYLGWARRVYRGPVVEVRVYASSR